ncbi:methionyl-tRNA formyltransferase [Pseudolabrys sp. Root1462]|uniref:methionyl-tRNA formyltransferase n=1 Tax=Pseudolabrys sp. Root1462 TaxID=1736466 RepID=UPI0009EC122F|nr:methionyl-tRNA formyltransferase [Pseudolabrys sp. Root1462]
MALISHFDEKRRDRYTIHDEIDATYFAFERDGRSLLQIDTFGRRTRQNPGRQSQTIQLDRESALALYKILQETFAFK